MIEYFVKSAIITFILYCYYIIFFRRSRNYHLNRTILLFSVFFSLIIPLSKISLTEIIPQEIIKNEKIYTVIPDLDFATGIASSTSENIETTVTPSIAYLIGYLVVSFLLLVRFIHNLYALILKSHSSDKTDYDGFQLTLIDDKVNPFSFFKTIFVNRNNYESGAIEHELLLHEIAHKKQLHSIDIIIMELIKVCFWFNPFIYLFNRLIKTNHEYLADDFVVKSGLNNKEYSNRLLNCTFRNKTLNLASGFNYSLIKNRLIMLSKYERKKRFPYRLASFIPVVAVLFLASAFVSANSAVDSSITTTTAEEFNEKQGTFYADTLFWSGETLEVFLKGKVVVKHGDNDFSGKGTFSYLGKVHMLVINDNPVSLNTSKVVSGMKCKVTVLSKEEAIEKYNSDGEMGAVEINTTK